MTLEVLGWVLLHSVWQAAAVAGALAIFLRAGGASTSVRYAASFGALILVAMLPVATGVVLARAAASPTGAWLASAGGTASLATIGELAADGAVTPAVEWVALVWIVAVVALVGRWAGGWWLVVRLTSRAARPARAAWTQSLRDVARRMGVTLPVELLESASVATPIVVGHRRPVVVLPVPAFEALASSEAESVLAHELAHVRRGDFVANAVQTVIEILFFFHPAVRWVSRVVRDYREQCCDDVAVDTSGNRVVYVRALAQLESLRSSLPVGGLALGVDDGTLLGRIERLVTEVDRPSRAAGRAPATLLGAAAATVACVSVVGSLLVPPTAHAITTSPHDAARYTVRAQDPAGEFSVTFEHGRPARAVVGGVAVARERLVTRGDTLFLPSDGGRFAVKLRRNGFTWSPRPRS